MPETPEQKARREIDAKLIASGWVVQDREEIDITASRGVAVREFKMRPGFGFADYLLYLDRKAVGAVEAKATGTLTGVEAQSAKYAAGLPESLPAHKRPLPFLLESNGAVTFFTNGLDPKPRSRKVFSVPRPETLAQWLEAPEQLRARLKQLPPLDQTGLWKVQGQAIGNLEESFAKADSRALIQMATGSGKTFTAVNIAYRLLKFGGAKRILFLVDRATSRSKPRTSSRTSRRPTTPGSSQRSIPFSGSRPIRSTQLPRWSSLLSKGCTPCCRARRSSTQATRRVQPSILQGHGGVILRR